MNVMLLGNVAGVAVAQGWSGRPSDLEEKVHAVGEVRTENKARARAFNFLSHMIQVAVPACRAHHHGLGGRYASGDVRPHRFRRGEIDNGLSVLKVLCGQPGAARVLCLRYNPCPVPAFRRHLGHQGPSFSLSQQYKVQRAGRQSNTSGSTSEKNRVCSRWIAPGTSASSTTNDMLISDAPCEIMRTLMSFTASKTCAATPGRSRMLSPTRQMIACLPENFTYANFSRSAAIAGIASFESTVTEMLTSDVDTISTAQRCRAKISNTAARNPCAISMRAATISMIVMRCFAAMALNNDFDFWVRATNRVPSFAGFREFSTSTGMFFSIAGNTVAGCNTLAPKYANSAASSKLMTLMRCASGQILGSVVFIPSTSVQISIRSAFNPAPAKAAVKSEPPRPIVVVIPSRVEPMNPPITGTRPSAINGWACICNL